MLRIGYPQDRLLSKRPFKMNRLYSELTVFDILINILIPGQDSVPGYSFRPNSGPVKFKAVFFLTETVQFQTLTVHSKDRLFLTTIKR